MRVLITGGTGLLGPHLVREARARGHGVRVLSRRPLDDGLPDLAADPGVEGAEGDLVSGAGLEAAVRGVDGVVHAASNPRDPRTVDLEGTRRLIPALRKAGAPRVAYPSIVGVDRVPLALYRVKRRVEETLLDSGLPTTVVRGTQFHGFLDRLLRRIASLGVVGVPWATPLQPVAEEEYAGRLMDALEDSPEGRAPDVAGPEIRTARELARSWVRRRGRWRPTVAVPLPGAAARAARRGGLTNPDRAVGRSTWEAWLVRRYG